MGDRLLRLVERWLMPWYSRDAAQRANERGEAIRQRSIAARIESERVREAYAAAGARTPRPRR
jgi:hypothetical protein